MNHLRASALTVEEFNRKENARTGQEIAKAGAMATL
jgi:hypothetical protein